MASQTEAARQHRARQSIGPRIVQACADFRMGDVRGFRAMGREDLMHAPECPNSASVKQVERLTESQKVTLLQRIGRAMGVR